MVGGMTVDWGSVMMKEHNQKITTTKAADEEDFTALNHATDSVAGLTSPLERLTGIPS